MPPFFHQFIPVKASVASWQVYTGRVTGSAVKIQPNPHWKELISGALLLHLCFTSCLPSPAFSSCPVPPPAPFFPPFSVLFPKLIVPLSSPPKHTVELTYLLQLHLPLTASQLWHVLAAVASGLCLREEAVSIPLESR